MKVRALIRRLGNGKPAAEIATVQFPHCDQRILHAPGECEYCDRHPDWQRLRQSWGIAFTGHKPVMADNGWTLQLPCPADFNRPEDADNHHGRWPGNIAHP